MGKSKNNWKCQNHTAPNRGAWSMFHPPPTIDGWATQPYQRAINKNFFNYLNKTFKLERTSYISHEQTQVYDKKP